MRKYLLNENFFEKIDSEEKAYFLGLLYADGYVNEKQYIVDLTLHNQDEEILKHFVKCLYPNNDRPLIVIRQKYLRLIISSKKIINDLIKHGCYQKKTFKITFPLTLPDNMVKHFIRGYFDGDGSITNNNGILNISIVGTIEFLNEIQKILIKNCLLNNTSLNNRHPIRNNNIRSLRYGGNIIINRIYHYMYDNANVCLIRKKNKFLDILKDKPYFCDMNYSRITRQKYYDYENNRYNKTDLSKIISSKLNIPSATIRKKITNGWTINEIFNTPPNCWRRKHNNI